MLALRPNCELCDRDLPPDSPEARICSYECTYCASCVETVLFDVCPTCGGNFTPRPIRPSKSHRPETPLGLDARPASTTRVQSKWSRDEIDRFVAGLRDTPPGQR
ncbi:DUF1272 domain-containing protein [Rhodobacteraceae bacterium 10Alg 79]|uniref:DUF1272 domain-containing protein n=2 Tax=Rhodalgimonas zhirmunskyi TaxID=2964767 RepID=A0AAJ1U986_9RHOB|nr:DUF1272 domain-containing protein [Rhodoalgimonas zhirmunskyi]